MNKLVTILWHVIAGVVIFGIGGLCFVLIPIIADYVIAISVIIVGLVGVLMLSLCTYDIKKDQQR